MHVTFKSLSATVAGCLGALLLTGVPPAAATTGAGTISGHVTIAGGAYATSVDVDLWTSSGEPIAHAVTNGNGVYSFDKLPAGSYVLEFENQTESMYEWYNNAASITSATRITVVNGATTTANIHMPIQGENLTRPVISGTPTVGSTLSATTGTWYPVPGSIAYQWLRDGSPVAGATSTTYVVTAADAGTELSFESTAQINSRYTPATSLPTATVPGGTVQNVIAPSVSGTAQVGSVLTATTGTWTPARTTVALQWLRDGVAVSGATGTSYLLAASDVSTEISVRATASRSGSTPATSTSTSLLITAPEIEPALSLLGSPTVSGTPRVGQVMNGTAGTWSPRPSSFAFQWLRSGAAIPGATSPSYRLVAADAGRKISLRVTATAGSKTAAANSAAPVVAKATTRAKTSLKAGRSKRLTVTTRLTSSGARTGVVKVSIRIGSKTTTKRVRLVRGTATVTVKGLRKGRATVTCTYAGDASTAPATTRTRATVR